MSETARRLGAAAALMTFAVALSRVIGYLREAFVAATFGASAQTDAFYAAFFIPDILNHLVAGGTLSVTLLPLYTRHLTERDEAGANRLVSVVSTVMTVAAVAGVGIGMWLAGPVMPLYFESPDPSAQALCVRLTRILLPAQIFFFVGALMAATLLARQKFAAAALAPLFYNVGIIAGGATLGGWLGVDGLAWGALAGAFAGPFLIPAISAVRHGLRLTWRFEPRDRGFREWLFLTMPLMVGASVVFADDLVIRYFASQDPGEITRLTYAKRLVAVPIAVAGQAMGQAAMPFFARLFAEGRHADLADTFGRATRGAGVLAVLSGAWLAALAVPAVELLFRRGRFLAEDVPPTALYLVIFAVAVPLWAVQGLLARVYYAARDTWTPMLWGTLVTVVSLPVYLLGWWRLGATGLAIASGAGILGHTLVLAARMHRKVPEVARLWPTIARGLAAAALLAAIAGGAAWGAAFAVAQATALTGHALALAQLTAGSVAFAVVVLALARPFGVREPLDVVARVARRLRPRSS